MTIDHPWAVEDTGAAQPLSAARVSAMAETLRHLGQFRVAWFAHLSLVDGAPQTIPTGNGYSFVRWTWGDPLQLSPPIVPDTWDSMLDPSGEFVRIPKHPGNQGSIIDGPSKELFGVTLDHSATGRYAGAYLIGCQLRVAANNDVEQTVSIRAQDAAGVNPTWESILDTRITPYGGLTTQTVNMTTLVPCPEGRQIAVSVAHEHTSDYAIGSSDQEKEFGLFWGIQVGAYNLDAGMTLNLVDA